MKLLKLDRKKRLRVTVLTVFCLLFQQVAVAAYACAMEMSPATNVSECHSRGDDGADVDDGADAADPLCEKHCFPDESTQAEARSISVPALGLPPAQFLPVASPTGERTREHCRASHGPAPPPELAYTRLLI